MSAAIMSIPLDSKSLARFGLRRGAYDGANRRRFILFEDKGDGIETRSEFDTAGERNDATVRRLDRIRYELRFKRWGISPKSEPPYVRATAKCIKHFVREAHKNKLWALSIDDAWRSHASDMSLKMADDYATQSIHEMARKNLEYGRMRAQNRHMNYPTDKPAHDLWAQLNT